jgi:hypothetical protein
MCEGKTKIYRTLLEPCRSRYRIPVISKAYKKQKWLGFVKERQLIYGSGETKMA